MERAREGGGRWVGICEREGKKGRMGAKGALGTPLAGGELSACMESESVRQSERDQGRKVERREGAGREMKRRGRRGGHLESWRRRVVRGRGCST